MLLHDQWDIAAALPYLAMGAAGLYLLIVMAMREARILRRRKQKARAEAERRITGPTPWNDWLREINEQTERDRLDTARD